MKICTTKTEMRASCAALRDGGRSLALVPTMGFLHDGHLALMRRAAKLADAVAVSIFVNPTQFGPGEDFERYPRDMARDLALLSDLGIAAVFTPDAGEMYGVAPQTQVDVPALSGILQGALRPGHFRGVATVVTKLLNVVQPDIAVFGEKDYQQLVLIRTLVRDLDLPVQIIGHPTQREADGLAMSSRNAMLTPEDRQAAVVLNRALDAAERAAEGGAAVSALAAILSDILQGCARAEVESIDIRDAETLAPLDDTAQGPAVILPMVRFGAVRLIDQRVVHVGGVS